MYYFESGREHCLSREPVSGEGSAPEITATGKNTRKPKTHILSVGG